MDHRDALERLCRVCGRQVVIEAMKKKHLCQRAACGSVQECHCVDSPDMHPQFFCHSCKTVLFKASNAVKQYQHRTVVFEGWCNHVEGSCRVCNHYCSFQQRGRPKKVKHTGRPPALSPRYCVDHIRDVAPPPLAPFTHVDMWRHHNQVAPTVDLCDLLWNPKPSCRDNALPIHRMWRMSM